MANSDNTFGTYNKQTMMHTQNDDGSTALVSFANADAAKAHAYTAAALAVFDECSTTIQWALVADGNGDNTGFKVTLDFGTKGAGTDGPADWAEQFKSRMTALQATNPQTWAKPNLNDPDNGLLKPGFTVTQISSHLF